MQQRYRGRGTIAVSRPLFCYQYNPLNILLIVNHRRAASADCIEMRADKYFAVWLELNAAIFIGGGHALEVGIGDTVLRHKIVNVHVNHLSKPSSLSVLPLGGIIPCHKIETIIHGIINAPNSMACRAAPIS